MRGRLSAELFSGERERRISRVELGLEGGALRVLWFLIAPLNGQ